MKKEKLSWGIEGDDWQWIRSLESSGGEDPVC